MTTDSPTLNKRVWEKFMRDSGYLTKSQKKVPVQGAHTCYQNGVVFAAQITAFLWDLGLDTEIRYCSACGVDLARGQCGVSPANENGYFHVACVTPEQWDRWLGAPRAQRPRSKPRRTLKRIQEALDKGTLVLEPGVTPEDALKAFQGR